MAKLPLQVLMFPIQAIYNLLTDPEKNFRATLEHLSLDMLFQKAIAEFQEGTKRLPMLFEQFSKDSKSGIDSKKATDLTLMRLVQILSQVKSMPLEVRHLFALMVILEVYSEADLVNIISEDDANQIKKSIEEITPTLEKLKDVIEHGTEEEKIEAIDKLAGENFDEFMEMHSPDPTLRAQSLIDEARKMLNKDK